MKKTFNELDDWLVQNWNAAVQLEESMAAIRAKYKDVFERIIAFVQAEKPELSRGRLHLTEFNGQAGIAKENWPGLYATWPSGFWIGDIGFDNLMTNTGDSPCAYVYLSFPKGTQFRAEEARIKIEKGSRNLLKSDKVKFHFEDETNPRVFFWYYLPEKRQELVQMLLESNSEKFVECIGGHLLTLAQFTPVLDKILGPAARPA